MKWLALVCALAGCNRIFDLQKTVLAKPDASVCWDPTQVSHDEDGDGIVDGCDLCPNVVDADQRDEDMDGVGDACDPHLGDNRDHLAFFDPFVGDSLDPRWILTGNVNLFTWRLDGDSLTQTQPDGVSTLILHHTFRDPAAEVVMTGQNQLDPTKATVQGVWVRIQPTDESSFPAGVVCFSYLEPNNEPNWPRRILVDETEPGQTPKTDSDLPMGDPTTLRVTSEGACAARAGDAPYVTATLDYPPLDGEVALRISGTTGTFNSIAVYERAP